MRRRLTRAEIALANCLRVSSGTSVIAFDPCGLIQTLLASCRQTCANDADGILVTLCPHHDNNAARDRADRNEAILLVGMVFVEDFEVVRPAKQQSACFFKGDAVFLLVREVLAASQVTLTTAAYAIGVVGQWLTQGRRGHPAIMLAHRERGRQSSSSGDG